MSTLWGSITETAILEKESAKNAIIEYLKDKKVVGVQEIITEIWQGYRLLTNYFRIIVIIEELEREGVIIKNERGIKIAEITAIENGALKKKNIFDVLRIEKR